VNIASVFPLKWMRQGFRPWWPGDLTNGEIGKALFISETTVKTHLLRAFGKLGVSDRTAAVTTALDRGLLTRRTTGTRTSHHHGPEPETAHPPNNRNRPHTTVTTVPDRGPLAR
jgi:DNA-binding CsgD family transcriptional regulator